MSELCNFCKARKDVSLGFFYWRDILHHHELCHGKIVDDVGIHLNLFEFTVLHIKLALGH